MPDPTQVSPDRCVHGGAIFDAIGTEFDQLERRAEVINADVLDAWFPPSPHCIGVASIPVWST